MKTNKPIAFVIFLLSGACLVITTLMTRQSGVSQAATAEGQAYLGYASIIIHLGLPAFGIGTGILMKAGNKVPAYICMAFVFLCAAFSINNVMSFVANERISVSKARDAEAKSKSDREQAAIIAAQKHQDTINKMAEQNLKWLQGTAKEADGRKERKDTMESASKFINEFAKQEVAKAPIPDAASPAMRTDEGVRLVAELTGWNIGVIQLSNTVQIVMMLILFESFGWSVAAYLWSAVPLATAAAAIPLSADRVPTALGGRHQRQLAAPSRAEPKVLTVRMEPSAEWRQLLDDIDYPPAGSRHKGPERPRIDPDKQALRFLCWCSAYNERGEISADDLEELYSDFLNADHRELTASRQVKGELESIKRGKFASKKQVPGRGTLWNIDPPPLDVMKQLLERGKVISTAAVADQESVAPVVDINKKEGSVQKTAASILPFWRSRQAGGLH